MKRVLSLGMSLALVASILPIFAGSAFAASYGTCGDWYGGNYVSGEYDTGAGSHINAVVGTIEPGTSNEFHPCSPTDLLGENASGGLLGVKDIDTSSYIYAGIIRCTNWSSNPLCDGSIHGFVETYAQFPLGQNEHNWINLGTGASWYGANRFKIVYNTNTYKWDVYVNDVYVYSHGFSTLLDPGTGDNLRAWFYGETHDRGDGLGLNVSGYSLNFGDLKDRRNGGAWTSYNTGSNCDTTSDQHVCVVNGPNGFYIYTTN